MTSAPGNNNRGFTLLELMVSLVILAVVLGMVTPLLHDGAGRRVTAAAERLARLLDHARQESVLSSRAFRLVLDPGADDYRFERHGAAGFEPITDALFAPQNSRGVTFDDCLVNGEAHADLAEVYLYPSGEQDTLRLTLRAGDETRVIALDAIGPPAVLMP